MTKPVHVTLEPNTNNTDGFALTLYYDTLVSEEEVKAYLRINKEGHKNVPGWVDTNDPHFQVERISSVANLIRWQAHPTV